MKKSTFLVLMLLGLQNLVMSQRPEHYDALEWRFIGPINGNRGSVVIGHPTEMNTFYFGASNGLWKTEDAGTYWMPVGDEDFATGNIGAMEFSLSDPNIIYVGMGEPQMRNNVSWGDGVYKSEDGGETWNHLGLKETHHISQVRVHPEDPNTVFVAACGHAFGPNEERGVFKTTDGGKTWNKVLYKNDKAGAIDLVMNPSNPNELFAVLWEFERKAWGPKTSGPASGMYKSTDGGETWTEITYNQGLPEGGRGRTGVTMSAANATRVYALIDSETKPGLYLSEDLGESWNLVSDYFQIIGRPFYYSHIIASPHDADEIWSPNNRLFVSKDAGKSWTLEPGNKDDFHDIWICPLDANRMIATNDGGCMVTMTGGETWSSQYTQRNSQFYRVAVDNDFPYNVYGAGQDILAYKIPSASRWGGISSYEMTIVGNGETGNCIPHPSKPHIVYSASTGAPMGSGAPFTVNNLLTGQNEVRSVTPYPMFGLNASDLKYRFNWDLPFFISPHDENTIYLGGNVVFKTTDEGLSWEVISPDLTNDIKDRQKITGSPWLSEYFGQEVYSTIKRLAESPIAKGTIWTGSDDGKVYLTQDGGENWEDVSIKDSPKYSQIMEVEPSVHDAATAYIAISNYNTDDDYRPYLYKTTDYGKTWQNLSENFPQGEVTKTIRVDPKDKNMLFVGTETGVFYSKDDGETWNSLRANMPAVPVVDITFKNNDVIIATNGRGFWVLDDITPLRANSEEGNLYPVSDFTRFGYNWWMDYVPGGDPGDKKNYFVQNMRPGLTYYEESFTKVNGERKRKFIDAGDPRPNGVVFYFQLEQEPTEIVINVLNDQGEIIRTYQKNEMLLNVGTGDDFNTGLNKFVWDMRINALPRVEGRPPTTVIPIVPPGDYTIQLVVDGHTEEQSFHLSMNPKDMYTDEQAVAKFGFWMEMYSAAENATIRINEALSLKEELQAQLTAFEESDASAKDKKKARQLYEVIEEEVNNYEGAFVSRGRTLAEVINQPATILFKLSFMSGILDHTEGPETKQMREQFESIQREIIKAEAKYKEDTVHALEAFYALTKS